MADPGEGPGGPAPPLFFDQTLARRAEKNFLDRPIPLISGSGWPGPPLFAGLDARMQVHYNDQVTFLSPLLPRSPRSSVVSTSPLTSFPHRFNSSNRFCFSTQFQLNTSYSVLSNKDSRISGVQSWCLGNVPEHGTLGTLTWSLSFFHIPTLRIRTGCQCPRLTWSWPSSRELMVTGSTSFLSLREQSTVLYPLLHSFSNDVWQGETEQICTQWYTVPKVWTMPFWAGSSTQSSSRVPSLNIPLFIELNN